MSLENKILELSEENERLRQMAVWGTSSPVGPMYDENKNLREALETIVSLDPSIDSTNKALDEWGEAECFTKAQVIARHALEDQTLYHAEDLARARRDAVELLKGLKSDE